MAFVSFGDNGGGYAKGKREFLTDWILEVIITVLQLCNGLSLFKLLEARSHQPASSFLLRPQGHHVITFYATHLCLKPEASYSPFTVTRNLHVFIFNRVMR